MSTVFWSRYFGVEPQFAAAPHSSHDSTDSTAYSDRPFLHARTPLAPPAASSATGSSQQQASPASIFDFHNYYQAAPASNNAPAPSTTASQTSSNQPLFDGDSRYEAVIHPRSDDKNVTAFSIPFSHIDKTKYYTLMPITNVGVRLLTYPFTLVKTRISAGPAYSGVTASGQQVQHVQYRGTWHALTHIVREEGPLALYKGLPISCLSLLTAPIYLTVLETSKSELERVTPPEYRSTVPAAAGAIASVVQQFFAVPLDLVTQRMMVSRGLQPVRRWSVRRGNHAHAIEPADKARTAVGIVRDILKHQGWRGLYRGFFMSIAQYAPFSSICWQVNASLDPALRKFLMEYNPLPDDEPAAYDTNYKFTRQIRAARADGLFINPEYAVDKPQRPKPLTMRDVTVSATSGGISGMVAGLLTTPIDVVKTRMQVNESRGKVSSVTTFRSVIHESGAAGLMAGTPARMLAIGQSSALLMVSYEVLKRLALKAELYADEG